LVALGCRYARPGEFSERAFLNDKLDLTQAEAIADLIASGSTSAARAARRSLEGVFSEQVHSLQQQLTELRVYVEAAIDFPEEEIDFLADNALDLRLGAASDDLTGLLKKARQGRLLRDGITLAIIGKPNAGKSSVLNALSGNDAAIVTDIPGTTRDVLREEIEIGGIPVHIADTAGIRETNDQIEEEGVRRARRVQVEADIVLLVVDGSMADDDPLGPFEHPESRSDQKLIVAINKSDLPTRLGRRELKNAAGALPHWESENGNCGLITLSARTGEGLDELRSTIIGAMGGEEQSSGAFSARQRHVDALKRVREHLEIAASHLENGHGELLAEELRLGQRALSEITGEVLPDDLLGTIFASFCIGK
jgi:tRNA modification GTPase